METRMGKIYSDALGREMEYIRYGSSGKPFFAVPSQDGRYFDFANFGMVDAVADYIEQGRIQIISFDTIDKETWSNEGGTPPPGCSSTKSGTTMSATSFTPM